MSIDKASRRGACARSAPRRGTLPGEGSGAVDTRRSAWGRTASPRHQEGRGALGGRCSVPLVLADTAEVGFAL